MNLRSFLVSLSAAILLLGCDSPSPGEVAPAASEPVAAPAARSELGSISKAGRSMPVSHYLILPAEKPHQLRVLFTPSELNEEERARVLEQHRMPFLALAFKDSPDPAQWDWYPFALAEFTFTGEPWGPSTISYFYLMSYGIAQPNHTDNINVSGQRGGLTRLAYDGEQLVLHLQASGSDGVQWDLRIGE